MLIVANEKLTFATWLEGQLAERKWNRAELARQSGLTKAAITKILNLQSFANEGSCLAIARALDLPPDLVLDKAGHRPANFSRKQIAENVAAYKLEDLSDSQLEEVIQYIDFIQERDARKSTKYQQTRKHRQGTSPAESLKQEDRT